ncbi:unnamed protein product [Schistosoma mattheei]|uniref:Uncharacterized protein n=1 Tax=Schistosoma mattheei TaxID=31246 RepID=A0AA85C1B6_9TREM|nr:unnamed protein product [Schistosoma mattheei]
MSFKSNNFDRSTWSVFTHFVSNFYIAQIIFLNSTWNKIVQRVTSGVFYFDLYLLLYNWLRSCILDTENLREVFYPSEYDDA